MTRRCGGPSLTLPFHFPPVLQLLPLSLRMLPVRLPGGFDCRRLSDFAVAQ